MIRWLFAFVHLLGLGIGLGAVYARAAALRGPLDRDGMRRVFQADTWWGIAALVWISTGLVRVLAGLEKAPIYYVQNHFFWTKMVLLLVVIALEFPVARTLARWRSVSKKGGQPDTGAARRLATTSRVEFWLTLGMVLLATGMARGMGIIAQ